MSFDYTAADLAPDLPDCEHTCGACFRRFPHEAISAYYAKNPEDCQEDHPMLCWGCEKDERALLGDRP